MQLRRWLRLCVAASMWTSGPACDGDSASAGSSRDLSLSEMDARDADAGSSDLESLDGSVTGEVTIESLDVSTTNSCVAFTDGTLKCWSRDGSRDFATEVEERGLRFTQVRVSEQVICGLLVGREGAACSTIGAISPWNFEVDARSIDTSAAACWVRLDRSLGCRDYSENTVLEESVPEGNDFLIVSNATNFACALRTSGEITCFGELPFPTIFRGEPPVGEYTTLSVSGRGGCGLRPDGSIGCFGHLEQAVSPPEGRFADVAWGNDRGCALDEDGRLTCWGEETEAAAAAPEIQALRFKLVSLYNSIACAVTTDDKVLCFGPDPVVDHVPEDIAHRFDD